MKFSFIINRIALPLFTFTSMLAAQNLPAQQALVKAKVEECMAAMVQGDFEKLMDLTYPPIVELMGGREAAAKALRKTYAEMTAKGFSFDSSSIRGQIRIVKTKNRHFAVVPSLAVIKTTEGKLFQEGTLLGISEDKGKSWTFIDVDDQPDLMLRQFFPGTEDLDSLLDLPPRPRPRYEKSK